MRNYHTMASHLSLICCISFFLLSSCSSNKNATLSKNSSQEMIIGHWVVESINIGQQIVPAVTLGREIRFSFLPDGTTTFTGPSGLTEQGRYQIKNSKIYDPENPTESPVDIVYLNTSKLIIAMIEDGEEMKMTLVPSKNEFVSRK